MIKKLPAVAEKVFMAEMSEQTVRQVIDHARKAEAFDDLRGLLESIHALERDLKDLTKSKSRTKFTKYAAISAQILSLKMLIEEKLRRFGSAI